MPPSPFQPVPHDRALYFHTRACFCRPFPSRRQARPKTPLHFSLLDLAARTDGPGAFLRYWRLGYQAYWTDDGYTLYRIRGTFAYLLTQIADQGFPPGWYTLLRLWRILLESRLPAGETYQPYLLRMLPAFFGTLTVPAMCFLGRQFTDRKGALLVALLAAVNPFLIYYSRDIKMYSTFYFFVALNMALFFHWLNSPRNVLWFPLFLLSGVLLTSMHSDAWALPVLQIIFLLFHRRTRPWDIPLWSIATPPPPSSRFTGSSFTTTPALEIRLTSEANRGLGWITQYTDMSWTTLASLPHRPHPGLPLAGLSPGPTS